MQDGTNIISDFLYDRKPFSDHTVKVLFLSESREIKGDGVDFEMPRVGICNKV
jgi:hypothetical protein